MNSPDYTATILVDQGPSTVFDCIKNFRAWWSEEIEGETGTLDKTFFYHYKDVHLSKIKLIEKIPNERLVYHILDNQFSFTKDKNEWTGTKLIFEISTKGEKTKVKFTHEGLTPEEECYDVCFESWNNYIKTSLYNLITTGRGNPNPKDSDGFSAEVVKKWKLK
ncbi:hypothetical protein GCM10009119_01930 [Algoriphagus jejuensis]|uniref:Activator of Hsp90 ATPase homologue 1/2-like C-terminal domain-containing protein n=1 Tax=Algoriphagus jejuensis TaxID=419934 RepID=A0ABP3Y6Y2_9BACT